jgi:hypothetical protein
LEGAVKVKSLRGEVHINGASHTEATEKFGCFHVQTGNHHVDRFGPGTICEIADDEARALINRSMAAAVSGDTQLSAPTSSEAYVCRPKVYGSKMAAVLSGWTIDGVLSPTRMETDHVLKPQLGTSIEASTAAAVGIPRKFRTRQIPEGSAATAGAR